MLEWRAVLIAFDLSRYPVPDLYWHRDLVPLLRHASTHGLETVEALTSLC